MKRNTDCVYFLASPLTCKKGIECEFRHSDNARLNPRDCWYWLAGCCLNPTCVFRHPPLEGLTFTAAQTAVTQQSVAPVKKTTVPCYFYFNSFCNKGDSCSFLHGPADSKPSWISTNAAASVTDTFSKRATSVTATSLEKKPSIDGDLAHAPVETREIKFAPEITRPEKIMPEKNPYKSTSSNAEEQRASLQISGSPCEEDVMRQNSLICREVEDSSPWSTDESTENQAGHFGQEELLESPPGFDVLVNDRSEELEYADGATYLEQLDEEYQEHNHQNFMSEYEDNVEYDPAYPDLRISFQQEIRNIYGYADDEDVYIPTRSSPLRGKERVVDHDWRPKRDLSATELISIDHSHMDLRDYLKKRKMVGVPYPTYSDYLERPRLKDSGRLHGRLASKVEMHSIGSQVVGRARMNDISMVTRTRQLHMSRSRPYYKNRRPAKRHNFLSEILPKKHSRKQSNQGQKAKEPTVFTGPKSLAEIKEEKKKTISSET